MAYGERVRSCKAKINGVVVAVALREGRREGGREGK
jgi:hypothetical protein